MSTTTSRRLPFSVPNVVVISVSVIGAIASALLGNIPGTVILGLLAIGILIAASAGRRAAAGDWLRVNAIEYRDERDRQLAARGFAVVGAWALGLSMLELVGMTLLVGAIGLNGVVHTSDDAYVITSASPLGVALALEVLAAVQVFVLNIVWGIANTRAVRRG